MFDIVHQFDGKWYFWDEIGDRTGPYISQYVACCELVRYCLWLDYGDRILGPNHLICVMPGHQLGSSIHC
jgi:hypothetical protein